MTTMNKIRAWSFAAFLGALALGDWQITKLVADGEEEGIPVARVNGVAVKGAVKDVMVGYGGETEKHWVVTLEGDGKGDLALVCTKMPWSPMSRMMPRPEVVWNKTVAFDTSVSRSIDLGVAPDADPKNSYSLVLGGDGELVGTHLVSIRPKIEAPAVEEVHVKGSK